RVGSLNLAYQTPQSMDVYIDCENQTVYHRLGCTMTSLMSLVSGDFPEITSSGSLEISGSGLNLSVRMLIVERS
ncbi:MAG: hypothetical protein PHU22_12040, partial [Eubacteriales bacterium]|nr:hypothetical protein [Eubacteriales bacterium]